MTEGSVDHYADAIWALVQRPSPAVTRDEIMNIVRVAMGAPTADEGAAKEWHIPPGEYLIRGTATRITSVEKL